MKKVYCLSFILLAAVVFITGRPVSAQEKEPGKSAWEFTVMPLVSTVGVSGTVGVDHLTMHLNAPWHKLKHFVKSGYALSLEARNDRHAIFFNGSYLKLEDDGLLRDQAASVYVDATLQITNMELAYSYRLAKRPAYTFDLFGGARYWKFKTELDVAIPVAGFLNSYSDTEQWVDPMVGFIFTPAITDKLSFMLKGDMGGFGVGSHFTWRGQGAFTYQFTKHVGAQVGYTYTYVNYSKNGFTADVSIQGAYGGLLFRF
jgi:hypothetical protein